MSYSMVTSKADQEVQVNVNLPLQQSLSRVNENVANHRSTLWKFHDFSIAQILREIDYENSSGAKSAILKRLEAMNFDFSCSFALFEN